jgi:hypothetical protein
MKAKNTEEAALKTPLKEKGRKGLKLAGLTWTRPGRGRG